MDDDKRTKKLNKNSTKLFDLKTMMALNQHIPPQCLYVCKPIKMELVLHSLEM